MFDNEIEDTEEYYSPLDALNEEDYDTEDSSYDGEGSIVECSNCGHSWDIADSSPEDTYVCHLCNYDNSEYDSNFDDSVFDMDFSEIRGKDFKQSFGKVNRKIAAKPVKRKALKPKLGVSKGVRPTGTPIAKPLFKRNVKGIAKPVTMPSGKAISRPASSRSLKPIVRTNKPLSNNIPVKEGRYNLRSNKQKKIAKVLVPNDQKVIIQGASKFILSQKSKDEGIKNIQYYKGKKLKPLVLIINNPEPTDFNFELFNPSMPLDYLYSTSNNLNNRITVAGGTTTYSDLLFNMLANPILAINCQITTAGAQVANQNNQPLFIKNKSVEGVQTIFPVNLDLQIDNMQVLNDIIYFNIHDTINRAFIPDGMDVINYKVLSGMTVTVTFWYTQVSLKKFFYEEARTSKSLL
jgi:hypothetical protein